MFYAGHLDRTALERGLQRLGYQYRWGYWADRLLLVIGAAFVLSGVLLFVAYNWVALDKMVKLGGLSLLVVVAVVAALLRGIDGFVGRVLLFAACMLVGVFLAAFGQIYQTGADAWELFRAWALLIAVWVVVSRSHAHWLLLLAVVDALVVSYLDCVHGLDLDPRHPGPWLALAALHGLALVALEVGNARAYFEPPKAWPRWVLVPALLFVVFMPMASVVFRDAYDRLDSWIALFAFGAAVAISYVYARYRARDLFWLTCAGFAALGALTLVLLRSVDVFGSSSCGSLVFVGLVVVAMLTGLVQWLRRVHVELEGAGRATREPDDV